MIKFRYYWPEPHSTSSEATRSNYHRESPERAPTAQFIRVIEANLARDRRANSLPAARALLYALRLSITNSRTSDEHKTYGHAFGIKVDIFPPEVNIVHAIFETEANPDGVPLEDSTVSEDSRLRKFRSVFRLSEDVTDYVLSLMRDDESESDALQGGSFFVGNIYRTDGCVPYFITAETLTGERGALVGDEITHLEKGVVLELGEEMVSILEIIAQFRMLEREDNGDSVLWLMHEKAPLLFDVESRMDIDE